MSTDDKFKKLVITTLAKRGGNRSSNPDFGATASGPADDQTPLYESTS